MRTQTVNVRLLLPEHVDGQEYIERLVLASRGTDALLGATILEDDDCSPRLVPTRVYTRGSINWLGDE